MSKNKKSTVTVSHGGKELFSTTDDTRRFNLYHADGILHKDTEYDIAGKVFKEEENTTYIEVKPRPTN